MIEGGLNYLRAFGRLALSCLGIPEGSVSVLDNE